MFTEKGLVQNKTIMLTWLCLVKHDSIISNIDSKSEVSAFTPDPVALQKVPMIDATILYRCSYTEKLYIHIMKNILNVTYTKHNLLILITERDSLVQFNSTPKIQAKYQTCNYHSIYFCDNYCGGVYHIVLRQRHLSKYCTNAMNCSC